MARRTEQVTVTLAGAFDRQPPASAQVEESLVGALLLAPNRVAEVAETLTDRDFFNERLALIFRALLTCHERHSGGDLTLLNQVLRDMGAFEDEGLTPEYLAQLAASTPGPAGISHWVGVLAGLTSLRELAEAAGRAAYAAYGGNYHDSAEIVDRAQADINTIAVGRTKAQDVSMGVALEAELEAMRRREVFTGLPTGLIDFDAMIGGLAPGEYAILGARPSMGKTALALGIALHVAQHLAKGKEGGRVGFFSLEMMRAAIAQRTLSLLSGVSASAIRRRMFTEEQFVRCERALKQAGALPIDVDDTKGLTINALRARIRRMVREYGTRLVVVDYLQLLTAPGDNESRQVEVSTISRGLKSIAGECNIPLLVLCQLNRGVENRADNRPRMSDLRESGSIEQDADLVALLHREEYYHQNDESWRLANGDLIGAAEIIVAKQRNGPVDSVPVVWDHERMRFVSKAGGAFISKERADDAGKQADLYWPDKEKK